MIRNEVETRILYMAHNIARQKNQHLPRLTLLNLRNRFDRLWAAAQFDEPMKSADDDYDGNIRNRAEFILSNGIKGELLMLAKILSSSVSVLYPEIQMEK